MNILIVTAMFPPIQTGTSFYSRNLASSLARAGHNVTVAALGRREPGDDDCEFTLRRLTAVRVPLKNYFKHFRISSIFPMNYLNLGKIAAGMKAEVILLVNHYQEIAFPAVYAARTNKIPLVVSVGTQLYSTNPRRDKILNIMERLICGRLIFPWCDGIISWDSQILQYLKDVHGDGVAGKARIIQYGVNGDINVFKRHRHDYGLHNQIIGVGALINRRDYSFLVRVFNEIKDEFPDLKVKIIGHIYDDGPVRMSEKLGLGGRITFTGEKPHEYVLAELMKSDIYWNIFCGKYTALGTASIETMLMGLPIFSNAPSDLFGERALLDGVHVIRTDGVTVGVAADKMRRLLKSRDLRGKVGQGGRAFVEEFMNWETVAQQHEMYLREFIH